jgi:hypothetical protein
MVGLQNPADVLKIARTTEAVKALLGISGEVFYVSMAGNDDNTGADWDHSFRSLTRAYELCSPFGGNLIAVAQGFYDENFSGPSGVVCDKWGVTLVSMFGWAFINNRDTTDGGRVFTITGAVNRFIGFQIFKSEFASVGSSSMYFDGAFQPVVSDCLVSIQKDGDTCMTINNSTIGNFLQGDTLLAGVFGDTVNPGDRINGDGINIISGRRCTIGGAAGTAIASLARGVVFGPGAFECGVLRSVTIDDCDIGVDIEPGAFGNVPDARIVNCDVKIRDLSGNTTNANEEQEHFEQAYPIFSGGGVAADPVTVSSINTDDGGFSSTVINYFGDTKVLIDIDEIQREWNFTGLEFTADSAGRIFLYQAFCPTPGVSATRNGGNNWVYNETVLTFSSPPFIVGDLIWVRSNNVTDGEIVEVSNVAGNVVTIIPNNNPNVGVRVGLAKNHGGGGEAAYLVQRPGNVRFTPYGLTVSFASAREFVRVGFHDWRVQPPGSGVVFRFSNATAPGSDSILPTKAVGE